MPDRRRLADRPGWLPDLVAANRNGFSPTWVPPEISWVVSGKCVPTVAPLLPMPRDLPPGVQQQMLPVGVEGVPRKRIPHKRPPSDSEVLVSAGQKQCFAVPSESAVQGVVAGAPVNVAAPHAQLAVPVVGDSPAAPCASSCESGRSKQKNKREELGLTVRMYNHLLNMSDAPPLGCARCRHSRIGCALCKYKCNNWHALHTQSGD